MIDTKIKCDICICNYTVASEDIVGVDANAGGVCVNHRKMDAEKHICKRCFRELARIATALQLSQPQPAPTTEPATPS